MAHPNIKHKNEMIDWARQLFDEPENYVILDTETTGLGNNDVVIQMGIIDLFGETILDTLIKPTKRKRFSREATSIHGITMQMLQQDAPIFNDIIPDFEQILRNKTVIIYNAKFDVRLIMQTFKQDAIDRKVKINALCAMTAYSRFIGEWNHYHGDYKFQKLPQGDHSAIGDCMATLNVIYEMANAEKAPLPKKKWMFWKE